jgi:hypothetical protein
MLLDWDSSSKVQTRTNASRPARPDSSSKPGDPRRLHDSTARKPPLEILHLRSPPIRRPPLRRCKRRSTTPPPQSSRRSPNPHPHPLRLPPPTLSNTITATVPFPRRFSRRRPSSAPPTMTTTPLRSVVAPCPGAIILDSRPSGFEI